MAMERRAVFGFVVWTLALVGCGSSTSIDSATTGSASSPATTSTATSATGSQIGVNVTDPAAAVAHQFLEAVVNGKTAEASALLTPLAIERIDQSGKPFQLPGLANYTFRVGQVKRPVPDKAFVQCLGTDLSTGDEAVNEEFCWLMSLVDDQWRIAGISYTTGPQGSLMIYSFENPEKGAIPVQKLMSPPPTGQTAAAPAASPATQPTTHQSTSPASDRYPAASPRTAQEVLPAGGYR
jgi:hypothetical protein